MLSSLARRSSKANHAYICTWCLSRTVGNGYYSKPSHRLPVYRAGPRSTTHAYSTTTSDATSNNGTTNAAIIAADGSHETLARPEQTSSVDSQLEQSQAAASRDTGEAGSLKALRQESDSQETEINDKPSRVEALDEPGALTRVSSDKENKKEQLSGNAEKNKTKKGGEADKEAAVAVKAKGGSRKRKATAKPKIRDQKKAPKSLVKLGKTTAPAEPVKVRKRRRKTSTKDEILGQQKSPKNLVKKVKSTARVKPLQAEKPAASEKETKKIRELIIQKYESGSEQIKRLRQLLLQSGTPKSQVNRELRQTLFSPGALQVRKVEISSSLKDFGHRHVKSGTPSALGETSSIKDAMLIGTKTPKKPKDPLRKSGTTSFEVKTVVAQDLVMSPLVKEQPPVPGLAYGLERVLFNPGVYQLQDPRSRVFNFDPYLQKIMPASEFDFNALKAYVTSSRDTALLSAAAEANKKYTGSTSSMTAALAHFHFLLSNWRPVHVGKLSRSFPARMDSFTAITRAPSSIFLRYRNGTYAIDADKEYDSANILMMLGKSMEKLLTLHTDEFEKYRRTNSDQLPDSARNDPESFHYSTMGDFLMRSQLDAYDPRLPGTGMFDLKTRAVASIRLDVANYEEGTGYEIRSRHGEYESYEREYYDMIRAAFLKYSLQVRMGRMDGIFVAFHNIERLFGFQYISISEMDYALHGSEDTTTGDLEFKLSIELLNKILDRATAKFPEKSLRIFLETRPSKAEVPYTYIFVKPVEESDIERIQNKSQEKIEKFEQEVLGIKPDKTDAELQEAKWKDARARVEEGVDDDDNISPGAVLESDIEGENEGFNKPEPESDLIGVQEATNTEKAIDNEAGAEYVVAEDMAAEDMAAEDMAAEDVVVEDVVVKDVGLEDAIIKEVDEEERMEDGTNTNTKTGLLGMILTVRNKVNGEYVTRTENLEASDDWTVEYALSDIEESRKSSLFQALRVRRRVALTNSEAADKSAYSQRFLRPFKKLSEEGRIRRQEQDELDNFSPPKVLNIQDTSKVDRGSQNEAEKE